MMTSEAVPRHPPSSDLHRNRELWALVNERFTGSDARSRWSEPTISWGLFSVPDEQIGLLGDVNGLDVVELGCGTAYFSAWLQRAGARPVALDLSRGAARHRRVGANRPSAPSRSSKPMANACPCVRAPSTSS